MIKQATSKILAGENLSADESRQVMQQIMSGDASPVQMAAYLTALRQKGETSEEILGAAQVMRDKVHRVRHHQDDIFDNCGTGGDGAGTFNISTTASFVIAACGLAVGKHGNRSVSSQCGSADVLQALGANISLSSQQMATCIDEIGIGFLFAPNLHPAMKQVAPVRKELGFRTIFNILGPLTNPAFATHQLIGVFDGDYTEPLAAAAGKLGIRKVAVVYNLRNIDELTTAGANRVSFADNGTVRTETLEPHRLGFAPCRPEDLSGGTAEENAGITMAILNGEEGPGRDTVILNAAVALMVADQADDVASGIVQAAESIDSGRAHRKLTSFVKLTQVLGNAE